MIYTYDVSSRTMPSAGSLLRTLMAILACTVSLNTLPKRASTQMVFIVKLESLECLAFKSVLTL